MIDIGEPPFECLSNFEANKFVFRGIACASMEGLLQSLKYENSDTQRRVTLLVGIKAKRKGQRKKWYLTHTLYWQGEKLCRFGSAYQALITEAFDALFEQSSHFREQLEKTGRTSLCHSKGKSDPKYTILTEKEFINQLYRLRDKLPLDNVRTLP